MADPAEPTSGPDLPVAEASSPSGGVMPFGRKPLRTFALVIALPAFLIYVATASLVIGGLVMMADEINRQDDDRTTGIVHAALDSFLDAIADAAADEGAWDEAYLNTIVELDPAWLDGTWGSTARAGISYDNVLVTDAAGGIVFGENNLGALTGNIITHFPAASPMLAELDRDIADNGDIATVSEFAADREGIAGLAAVSIHRATPGEIVVPRNQRRVLWIARHLTPAVLGGFSETFRVPVLEVSKQPAEDVSFAPIGDANGLLLGSLTWQPERPGDKALLHALLLASTLLFVIGLILAFGLSLLRRALLGRAGRVDATLEAARRDASTGHLSEFGLLDSLKELLSRTPAPKAALGGLSRGRRLREDPSGARAGGGRAG